MPTSARAASAIASVLLLVLAGRPAFGACDTAANAVDLAAARDAIDAACDCGAATKPSQQAKCAKPVIAARIAGGMLDKSCKSEALKHATKSICGRPGAVVCCRVKSNGKTSHKIAKSAGKCTSTAALTACISVFPSVPSGCDASGCLGVPVCGNGTVEPGETCDPPQADVCDAGCHVVTCEPPTTTCGNGTISGGETCEPPGVGACGWDCQATTCAAPGAGEIAVACSAEASATVGVGARSGEYLVAWNDVTYRPHADVVARRLDGDGAPVDASATIVSDGVTCAARESMPAVGADAAGYALAWASIGPDTPTKTAIHSRRFTATLGPLEEPASTLLVGMCQSAVGGSTSVAPFPLANASTFATMWRSSGACVSGPSVVDPDGALLDYGVLPTAKTPMNIGFFPLPGPPPSPFPASDGPATLATLGTATLATWYAELVNPPSGMFVAGTLIAANGTTAPFTVSSRQPATSNQIRPGVAAGSTAFLVAWANGPSAGTTEIRGMRVTSAGAMVDPDGGLLLATTSGGAAVTAGPVVAFDGTVWLVAWSEVGASNSDLRAVAVQSDGTVVDATPRLLASGVSGGEPAIASAGDGRSLVVYVRPDGGKSAVRAQLVPSM